MQGEWSDWRGWGRVSIRGRQMRVRRTASEMMGAGPAGSVERQFYGTV